MPADYIVIGSGSGGAAVAARLAEDPRNRVILLEAGPKDTNPFIHIPAGFTRLLTHPKLNWRRKSEPVPGLGGRRMPFPSGKVLGGSSAINGMLYIRGQAEDYDAWRDAGNAGWGWKDVLPYFRKAEDQQHGESESHGVGGPIGVSDTQPSSPASRLFLDAAVRSGIPRLDDLNTGDQHGIALVQGTIRNGRRMTTAVGYLRPAAARKKPAHRDGGAGGPHRRRRRHRHRRRLYPQVRRHRHRTCGARGRALRGRRGLASDPAAIGDRRCRPAQGARHRAGPPSAGGGGEPPGPPVRLRPAPAEERGTNAQPTAAQPPAARGGGAALRPLSYWRAGAHLMRGLRLSRFQGAGRPAGYRDHLPPAQLRSAAGRRLAPAPLPRRHKLGLRHPAQEPRPGDAGAGRQWRAPGGDPAQLPCARRGT